MYDDYETTADLMEDWHYSRLDADMEQAEMERDARQARRDIAEGRCAHASGVLYRETAFYPEQIGLSPGQMFCYDCKQAVADPNGAQCVVCDLDRYNCMAERGCAPDTGKYAHETFVTPPMILVCNVMGE